MNSVPVLVTGAGGAGFGEQIYKALKLAPTPYEIIVADMSAKAKAAREVNHSYVIPAAKDPTYLARVLEICKKHQVKALFCGSEPELKVLSKERAAIEKEGIFLPLNPASVIDTCMDKTKSSEFLQANGFPVPKYARVTSMRDLEAFPVLPAVIKPSVGSGGSVNVFLAQTSDELRDLGKYLFAYCPEIIVQEYVGTPDSEFTVGVLLGMDGELINSIALKRDILGSLSNRLKVENRTGKPELGRVLAISSGISQGIIGRFPEVTKPCERIALALGCRGAVNIQCRVMGNDVYVFEINPRFSGTTSLRAMVGYNEPDVLVRKHVFGETIKPNFDYRSNVTIIRTLTETALD